MKFFKEMFSMDETKTSTIIITFVITLAFCLYSFFKTNKIDGNMLTLLLAFIGSIAGVNGINVISTAVQQSKKSNNTTK